MGKIFRGEKKLVKYDVSAESLLKYHRLGWHFFIRTVDERRYITIRRKGKERSLGPYSDELWRIIEGLGNKGAREGQAGDLSDKLGSPRNLAQSRVVDEGEARILKTIEELTQRMINVKYRICLRVGIDGFCGYWVLKELPEQTKQLNQKESEYIFKKLSSGDGKASSWRLKPFPSICNNCPAYFDEQMLSLYGTRYLSF